MEFTNELYRYVQAPEGPHRATVDAAVDALLRVLAPAVPHITAELWAMRHDGAHIHAAEWPVADPAKLVVASVTMVVQVNGKVRDKLEVPPGISDADAEAAALASDKVQVALAGATPKKTIVRAPKLVNLVV
jgi:leucyl-tRNA synthetase